MTSYPIPLNFTPTLTVIKAGAPSTAPCPGSVENPSATAGNLCIYEQRETGEIYVDNEGPSEEHFGFFAFSMVVEKENYEDHGTWAVTAP